MINFIYYLLVYGIYTYKTLRFEIKKYNDSIDVSIQSYLGTCLLTFAEKQGRFSVRYPPPIYQATYQPIASL